jgi:isoleucyl-tRNA synthetase
MPLAQWHYPFENADRVEREHPADFISEGVDQTRGWFYTLLAVSAMVTGKPAYKTCVSLDLILDAKGKKMAKSRGNVIDPFVVIDKYGADVVRWHLLVRPLGTPMRYEERDLLEIRNRFFGTLLNVYQFFATYANIDGYTGDADVPLSERPVFDQWLVSRLHGLFADVTRDLESFNTGHAGQRIANFVVEDLSNWYVRRNRRRFFRTEMTDDKRSAYQTLHAALLSVAQLAAPFVPFVTETLYGALTEGLEGAETSVHMATWPVADASLRDAALEANMAAARRMVSLVHAARDKAGVRTRQPLARMEVWGLDAGARAFIDAYEDIVRSELNLKEIVILETDGPSVALKATLDKKEAARRLGPKTPAVSSALEALDTPQILALLAASDPVVETPDGPEALRPADVRVEVEGEDGFVGEFGGGLIVTLDTRLTPELRQEGLAREILRQLQVLRKDLGFRVEDRVRVRWDGAGDAAESLEAWSDWIAQELLAVEFTRTPEGAGLRPLKLPGDHDLRALLERA